MEKPMEMVSMLLHAKGRSRSRMLTGLIFQSAHHDHSGHANLHAAHDLIV